jgi:prolyl oligopeptidase
MNLNYPFARKENLIETLHGTPVPDPYRWMEDVDSPETHVWIDAQNQLTNAYLNALPGREAIKQRMTALWDFEKFSPPSHHAGRYFYSYNSGLENQDVLYWMEGLNGEPQVLLDPNKLSNDGTIALTGTSVSHDGNYLAYALSEAGSDWQEWRVRRVDNGVDELDHLRWVKFSQAAWDKNSQGFYYSRYDAPTDGEVLKKANYDQKLYYHKLGTDQGEDTLIYARPEHKEWGFGGFETDDGAYMVIIVTVGTQEEVTVYVKDLSVKEAPIQAILPDFDAEYHFIDNKDSLFYFLTTESAPLRRVVGIDVRRPQKENWVEIIPESRYTLENVSLIGGRFICTYLSDAVHVVRVYDLTGRELGQVVLPGLGTVTGFAGKSDDVLTFYSYTDITTPPVVYQFDPQRMESKLFHRPILQFDPAEYTTEQVFITSKDGTQVPMFISYKKGLQKNGCLPTYLFGYGGFNISIPVMFRVPILVWMELGGVYAQVQLRGGGEYGEAWHQAGMKANKQNVFDDFISAAEWLIDNGYTRRESLAIGGRSNGGLLVGAVMTQRPDLFGVCMPTVGVMDMLRFHKFTIGWAWVSDYGSPDDPDDFKVLHAYSPYHNIKKGRHYPPTMITTGDHDDRVYPAHSYKFAAALQETQAGEAPVLVRIDTRAGHGVGKPTTKLIEEHADLWAFTLAHLK